MNVTGKCDAIVPSAKSNLFMRYMQTCQHCETENRDNFLTQAKNSKKK